MNERRRNRRETPATVPAPVVEKSMAETVKWWVQIWRGERSYER